MGAIVVVRGLAGAGTGPDAMVSEARIDLPTEERDYNRYEGSLEGHLLVDGGWWACRIRDLSLGGAGLEPAIPAALGKTVALSSPFFDFEGEIPGRVVNVSENKTCLAFDLDESTKRRLARFLIANT